MPDNSNNTVSWSCFKLHLHILRHIFYIFKPHRILCIFLSWFSLCRKGKGLSRTWGLMRGASVLASGVWVRSRSILLPFMYRDPEVRTEQGAKVAQELVTRSWGDILFYSLRPLFQFGFERRMILQLEKDYHLK